MERLSPAIASSRSTRSAPARARVARRAPVRPWATKPRSSSLCSSAIARALLPGRPLVRRGRRAHRRARPPGACPRPRALRAAVDRPARGGGAGAGGGARAERCGRRRGGVDRCRRPPGGREPLHRLLDGRRDLGQHAESRQAPIAASMDPIAHWARALARSRRRWLRSARSTMPVLCLAGGSSPASSRGVTRLLAETLPDVTRDRMRRARPHGAGDASRRRQRRHRRLHRPPLTAGAPALSADRRRRARWCRGRRTRARCRSARRAPAA